jgi:arabinogalactan oligomer/maltooligosaccharide transport system substrate-binding protein
VINGPWAFQPYEAAGINYGVAPLPNLPDGKPMSSFLGVKGYVVSTWSKDKRWRSNLSNSSTSRST